MRQQKKEHFTRQSSSIAGQSFNVELSAKLFETVYSNMYRYKEAATVRELLCNAIDAHEMRDRLYKVIPSYVTSVLSFPQASISKFLAPKGTQAIVHLPDEYEPWLEIKDFGIGLSLEQVIGSPISAEEDELLIQGNMIVKEDSIPEGAMILGEPGFYDGQLVFRSPENNEIIRGPGLYTTLFRSTKSEDNDQIGAFGLGSKSPFAVSDSFTVETRYEGKVHRFLMYLNADRIPCCDTVTKDLETRDPTPDDTDEYNGLTVRVPIKSTEYNLFANELVRLGRVMDDKNLPEVVNDRFFHGFKPISRTDRVNNTYIQEDRNGNHFAVMGGVSYPIETAQLDENLSALLSRFPSTYTFFDIGELNVPPSREDLVYDEFTRESIEIALTGLRDGIVERSVEDVKAGMALGPIHAFYAKMRYRTMFGDSFLSVLNEIIPMDKRYNVKGDIVVPGYEPVLDNDAVRKLAVYPSDMIRPNESFFKITQFNVYSRLDDVDMNVTSFKDRDTSPTIVIMDDTRAYTQKCKTLATRTNRAVLLIEPDRELLARRNSKLGKIYKNAKEMRGRIVEWIGKKEKIDYLQFADKFAEFYDGIISADSIRFTSELDYDRLVVDGNLGIMRMQYAFSRHGNHRFESTDMDSADIIKISESGNRMVYVEMSNYDIISDINGKVFTHGEVEAMWKLMSNMMSQGTPEDQLMAKKREHSWVNHKQYSPSLLLVRRKAVPFMKRNKEYFVSFQDVLKEFAEDNQNMRYASELSTFSSRSSYIKHTLGRMNYYKWVSQAIKNDEHFQEFDSLIPVLNTCLANSKTCGEAKEKLLEGKRSFYAAFNSKIDEFFDIYYQYHRRERDDDVYGITKYKQVEKKVAAAIEKLARTIGTQHEVLTAVDTHNRRLRRSRNDERKVKIRSRIEKYLLVQHAFASYKPVMGNKLDGKDQFMKKLLAELSQ